MKKKELLCDWKFMIYLWSTSFSWFVILNNLWLVIYLYLSFTYQNKVIFKKLVGANSILIYNVQGIIYFLFYISYIWHMSEFVRHWCSHH